MAGLGDGGLETDAGEFGDLGGGVEHGDGIGGDVTAEHFVPLAEADEDEPLVGAVGGDHRLGVDVAGDAAPELGGPGAGGAVAALHHAGVGDKVEVVRALTEGGQALSAGTRGIEAVGGGLFGDEGGTFTLVEAGVDVGGHVDEVAGAGWLGLRRRTASRTAQTSMVFSAGWPSAVPSGEGRRFMSASAQRVAASRSSGSAA